MRAARSSFFSSVGPRSSPRPGVLAALALCLLSSPIALADPAPTADDDADEPTPASTAGDGKPATEASAATPARSEAAAHRQRAKERFAVEDYVRCGKELLAAYALDPDPTLLLDLARASLRLGNAAAALAYDERFLAAPGTDNSLRAAASAERARLLLVLPPPGAAATGGATTGAGKRLVRAEVYVEQNRTLVGFGLAVVSLSYGFAINFGIGGALSGPSYYYNPQGDQRLASGALLVPLVGPFLASGLYRDGVWILGWTLLDGMSQLTGLAMIIAGSLDRHVAFDLGPVAAHVQVLPYAAPGGGGLVAGGKF